MPPLPPNNTDRLFVDYTTGETPHHFTWRFSEAVGLTAVQNSILVFLETLDALLHIDWAVTGARIQPAGTDFSLPVALGPLDGFTGQAAGSLAPVQEPREFVWVGRSTASGRRWELSIYGVDINTPDEYRFNAGGGPPFVGASIAALRDAVSTGTLVAIDGSEPVIYDYVNVNYNSHWETERRG